MRALACGMTQLGRVLSGMKLSPVRAVGRGLSFTAWPTCLKKGDRVRRGGVPLRCALYLLRRRGELAGLVVLRPMATRLELGESAQSKSRHDVLDDRRDGCRVARRHQGVGTDPGQEPVAVGVEGHHPVGEAVDPHDSVVGVPRGRAYEKVGLRAPRWGRAGADAAHVVDKAIKQDGHVVVALRWWDGQNELLGAVPGPSR